MVKEMLVTAIFTLSAVILTGCTVTKHTAYTQEGLQEDRLTVGVVQKEIRKGMSGAEVAAVLGSPNIISTDEQGREVWIYDKIATDRVYSESSSGGTLILLWGRQSAGASSTSQRTLTVIIKFDKDKKVSDFAYHSSAYC